MIDDDRSPRVRTGPLGRKKPLDVRVLECWVVFTGCLFFFGGILLLLGLAHTPSESSRRIFLGLVSVSSDMSTGTVWLFVGILGLISGYGLIKRQKFGWWLACILCVYGAVEPIWSFPYYSVTASISICLAIAMLCWLLYRRRYYGIRVRSIGPGAG